MISGRPLVYLLILLAAWFSLLCGALWQVLRRPLARGPRTYLTVVGLGCSTMAVGALLVLHLSWLSVVSSQRLGEGGIRILALLLFWPTLAGFVLSIAGSGRMRFLGVGTCLATGFWWFFLAISAGISMGAPIARYPTRFLIPKGYVGWVKVKYGETAPPLEMSDGTYICRIPANGILATSSRLEDGWAKDEYFYYSDNDSLEALPDTGWGGGGMIWAGNVGWEQPQDGSRPMRVAQSFYVGREDQYRRSETHAPDQ